MAEYKFRALMRDGKITRGKMMVNSKHELISKLKEAKLQPVFIKKIKVKFVKDKKNKKLDKLMSKIIVPINGKNSVSFKNLSKVNIEMFSKIKSADVIAFTNNLYILKKANFNNIQALESLYEGTDNAAFKDVIEDLLIAVQSGEKLHVAMKNYSNIFSTMYINFVKVGEESGALERALLYARDYLEASVKLKKQVKAIIIPKVLQFILIIGLMFAAVIFGVPIMQQVYDVFNSSAQIPEATQIAFDVANWFLKNWYILFGIMLLAVIAFILYISTPKGKYEFDRVKMKFPVVGNVVTSIIISKFFQAMLLNLKNGMRIQESLDISKGVSDNYYFLSIVEVAKNNSLIGESWITPFQDTGVFNSMTTEMISIGMKSDLPEMMAKVNEYIMTEIDEAMNRFNKWLPEIMYAIVGIAMIIFVLVVMVPMIHIYMGSFIEY